MAAALLAKMTASFHSRLLFFSFQTFCFAGETGRSKLDARKTNVQRLKKLVKKKISKRRLHCAKKKAKRKKNSKEIANLKSVCFERLLLYVCSKPSASSVTWAYSPEKMKPTSPNFATISSRTKWGKVDKWLFTCDSFCFCLFSKLSPVRCCMILIFNTRGREDVAKTMRQLWAPNATILWMASTSSILICVRTAMLPVSWLAEKCAFGARGEEREGCRYIVNTTVKMETVFVFCSFGVDKRGIKNIQAFLYKQGMRAINSVSGHF